MSPFATCGRKRCTTQGSRDIVENRSKSEPKFGSSARDLEHRRAAIAIERLHHHLAVLGAEGLDLGAVARDQRRRHQIAEIR